MNAYVYRAALYCEDCTAEIKEQLHSAGVEPSQDDALAYQNYDSDDYPHGPFPNGGGEADSPQHCDECHVFLENALTIEGERWTGDALTDDDGEPAVLAVWRAFYPALAEYADRETQNAIDHVTASF